MADYVGLETTGHVLLEDGTGGVLVETAIIEPTADYVGLETTGHVLLEDGTGGVLSETAVVDVIAYVAGGGVSIW